MNKLQGRLIPSSISVTQVGEKFLRPDRESMHLYDQILKQMIMIVIRNMTFNEF